MTLGAFQLLANLNRCYPLKTWRHQSPLRAKRRINQFERLRAGSSSSSHARSQREESLCPEDQCMHVSQSPLNVHIQGRLRMTNQYGATSVGSGGG